MRDPERIQAFLKHIETLWSENPDWRFGQLVENVADRLDGRMALFAIEDHSFQSAVKAMIDEAALNLPTEGSAEARFTADGLNAFMRKYGGI